MNYKTYVEAKIANPESEIVTTGKDWSGGGEFIGTFEARLAQSTERTWQHCIGDDSWVICNPADYCSSLKEFFDAGFELGFGDKIIGTDKSVWDIAEYSEFNEHDEEDNIRYILSAAALNGGCKIPVKAEQWAVYNNTMPLCELTDEQRSVIFNSWAKGGARQLFNGSKSVDISIDDCNWHTGVVYRIKPKSERELFIENTTKVMRDAGTKCPDNHEYFGIMFDAGARYKDLTQHFGENI